MQVNHYWYVDSNNPGPSVLWTSIAHPNTWWICFTTMKDFIFHHEVTEGHEGLQNKTFQPLFQQRDIKIDQKTMFYV